MYYFLAWLSIAGFDLREFPIAVVPFSLSPELPVRTSPQSASRSATRFVYGGTLQPWQDPVLGLQTLADELSNRGSGDLHIYGGANWIPQINERFQKLQHHLQANERIHFHGALPRAELLEEYARADVAWDLMTRNPERELAFTSRTVEYLWCGLPVVYNNYAELADYIAQYDAGWIVDPADEVQIRAVAQEIMAHSAEVRRKGANAQSLVRERLAWDVTIDPLDQYCRQPHRAAKISQRPYLDSARLSSLLVSRTKKIVPASTRVWLRKLRGIVRR
jgi:glycosyltransferase involved in cell wall biosynthesis